MGLGAGLGVGIPFLLLLGGLLGYIFFRRQSKKREIVHAPEDKPVEVTYYGHHKIAELRGGLPHELRGDAHPHEMPHGTDKKKPPSEMEA